MGALCRVPKTGRDQHSQATLGFSVPVLSCIHSVVPAASICTRNGRVHLHGAVELVAS